MDSLHSWKTRFRKTFYWKNTRNGQNHARRRLPWEAFETTSYNRNLWNFHTKKWLHLVTIVNDNISDTKTIHGPRKTLQIPQKKMNPFQVCPRKIVKTHARKNVRRDVFVDTQQLNMKPFNGAPSFRKYHLHFPLFNHNGWPVLNQTQPTSKIVSAGVTYHINFHSSNVGEFCIPLKLVRLEQPPSINTKVHNAHRHPRTWPKASWWRTPVGAGYCCPSWKTHQYWYCKDMHVIKETCVHCCLNENASINKWMSNGSAHYCPYKKMDVYIYVLQIHMAIHAILCIYVDPIVHNMETHKSVDWLRAHTFGKTRHSVPHITVYWNQSTYSGQHCQNHTIFSWWVQSDIFDDHSKTTFMNSNIDGTSCINLHTSKKTQWRRGIIFASMCCFHLLARPPDCTHPSIPR